MIVSSVQLPDKPNGSWKLSNPCGEKLLLPGCSFKKLRIGLLGTRSTIVKKDKTKALAAALESLDCPVIVVDIRRSGMGGSGSWGPMEFSCSIPSLKKSRHPYSFHHVPLLAPNVQLLTRYRKACRCVDDSSMHQINHYAAGLTGNSLSNQDIPESAWKHWQVFRASYARDLSKCAINSGWAFVEAGSAIGGVSVFLCAEEHLPSFDDAPQAEQDQSYCHRYTATSAITRAILADDRNRVVERVYLRLGAEPESDTSPEACDPNSGFHG